MSVTPYRALSENLPTPNPKEAGDLPVEPKRLKGWIEALPHANQDLLMQHLGDALHQILNRRMDGFTRFEALEQLRPVVLDNLALVGGRLSGSTFPLAGPKAALAENILKMQRDLAHAYRMALIDACPGGKVPFLAGGKAALAAERAMYHGSRHIFASYYLYRLPEQGAWGAINAILRFARSVSLHEKQVEEPAEKMTTSVMGVYIQALLLSLANPYCFNQKELVELWTVTRDLAPGVVLSPQRFGPAGSVAMIELDTPPAYHTRAPDASNGAVLWIDLREISKRVIDALDRPLEGQIAISLGRNRDLIASQDLMKRASDNWEQAGSRIYPRVPADHAIEAVIGLSGVHYHLAGRVDFDNFLRDLRGIETGFDERAGWAAAGADASRMRATAMAKAVDQSLGGYRLRWESSDAVRARIGEIIGLSVPYDNGERNWMVGIVRWLRYDGDAMDAGIDLIGHRAHAIGVRAIDHPTPRAPVRAIEFADPLENDGGERLRLLVPSVIGAEEVGRLEITRGPDPADFDERGPQIYYCTPANLLEAPGDYLVLSAQTQTTH